jgi:hypothetical protein
MSIPRYDLQPAEVVISDLGEYCDYCDVVGIIKLLTKQRDEARVLVKEMLTGLVSDRTFHLTKFVEIASKWENPDDSVSSL